ncbi:MFS transporter [Nocardia aurantia]|uniref:Putative multidrug resistance protein MdtD n=1 Tax=Nocardia aurantia TaxID=2585199 RepID=A0A7K0DJK1_9NOCA|nr:MFS transporter [Nocardia aurantia]MQY25889.1 putative multidrug resistance protein MdtD [Nocardia aurantia]
MTQIAVRKQGYTATVVAGCFAVLLAQVAYSLPGALNGTFQQEFQTTGAQLTWVTAAFAIPMVVLELTTGVIGDLFGRKRLLQAGAVATVAGSLICYLAGTVQVLWAGQVVAGLGAAILYPISLAMLAAVSPTPEARSRAIAVWAGFLSIGAAVSPLLGGWLAQQGHWRTSYLVVIAAAVVSIAVTQFAADSAAPEGRKLDVPGQLTLALGLIAILFGATQGSEAGFGRPEIIGAFVAGVVLLGAFVVIELRTAVPLLNLKIFANRAYAVVAIATVVGMFAFLAICYSLSIRIGAVQHQSALKIGVLFLFIQGPAFLLAPVVSYLIRNVAPRWVLTTGFALIAVSGIWSSTFDIDDPSWTVFIAPMLALGIGFALTVGSITAVAINTVPLRLAGMASATTNLLRDFGFALGPVLIAAIAVSRANGRMTDELGTALGESGLRPPYTDIAGGIAHEGGAMAINSMPVVPGAGPQLPPVPMPASLHTLAFESLGSAYSLAFLVAGLCGAAAAVLTLVGLLGSRDADAEEPLVDAELVPAE